MLCEYDDLYYLCGVVVPLRKDETGMQKKNRCVIFYNTEDFSTSNSQVAEW